MGSNFFSKIKQKKKILGFDEIKPNAKLKKKLKINKQTYGLDLSSAVSYIYFQIHSFISFIARTSVHTYN